ncbi:hypothetical protein BDN72DRAFT_898163 [Pluteus cervinus]|uniref:Uncharacterized protein n=1 Tax=Pluteus cervinus TaxID=181527 RepID=A0ACD3AS62_9AGAR|nr:hypothetical protein BDN72DRAFT_898163 [Pluteus cervinus]
MSSGGPAAGHVPDAENVSAPNTASASKFSRGPQDLAQNGASKLEFLKMTLKYHRITVIIDTMNLAMRQEAFDSLKFLAWACSGLPEAEMHIWRGSDVHNIWLMELPIFRIESSVGGDPYPSQLQAINPRSIYLKMQLPESSNISIANPDDKLSQIDEIFETELRKEVISNARSSYVDLGLVMRSNSVQPQSDVARKFVQLVNEYSNCGLQAPCMRPPIFFLFVDNQMLFDWNLINTLMQQANYLDATEAWRRGADWKIFKQRRKIYLIGVSDSTPAWSGSLPDLQGPVTLLPKLQDKVTDLFDIVVHTYWELG